MTQQALVFAGAINQRNGNNQEKDKKQNYQSKTPFHIKKG
ncbi:hypothetical protein PPEP_b0313 [Pseudoalteromonas peptidolytica F12-50-A1]|uniref:Uncharacterized protein n=1 Tax=Pseudoalteromonas peptidolytica F12-50-A1 TaxID=1315280 RepID=A0A8I0T7T4_9GAMM|nr:hypothetical protein [Pseudoalteromonas peptidolytica F12-50-A1]